MSVFLVVATVVAQICTLRVLTALFLGYMGFTWVHDWYRLRHIPGPFWSRWSIFWVIRDLYKGTYINKLDELHAQYGPLVCIGPGWVSLSDPNEIRRIHQVRSPWGRGPAYEGLRLGPGVDASASVIDKQKHHQIRSKLEPGYYGKGVTQVHQQVDERIMKMVRIIHDDYTPEKNSQCHGKHLNLSELIHYLLVDTTSSLAFGRSFGCLDRQEDFHEFIETSVKKLPIFIAISASPIVQAIMKQPMLKVVMDWVGLLGPIALIAKKAAAERFGAEKITQQDMLGAFVAHGISQEELETETVVQLIAGSETTMTGILNTMLCLLTAPDAYRKLQSEIDEAIRSGKIRSFPASESEAKSLPYLQAVIKEGLRLLPPAGYIPKGCGHDSEVCGLRVPANVNVDISVKSAVRDKAIYGEDADVFRPERWLEVTGTKLFLMDETWRIIFGGPSRWECLGKGLALTQINKVYIELFRQFNFTIVNRGQPFQARGSRTWIITDFIVAVRARD
ncbi:cytochrome P450 71A20 [Camillea tinctor]|nr:cytochrome P450 71A20 [Camillea tinctor]